MGKGGHDGEGNSASIHHLIGLRSLQCGGALGQYRSRESKVAIPTDQKGDSARHIAMDEFGSIRVLPFGE